MLALKGAVSRPLDGQSRADCPLAPKHSASNIEASGPDRVSSAISNNTAPVAEGPGPLAPRASSSTRAGRAGPPPVPVVVVGDGDRAVVPWAYRPRDQYWLPRNPRRAPPKQKIETETTCDAARPSGAPRPTRSLPWRWR